MRIFIHSVTERETLYSHLFMTYQPLPITRKHLFASEWLENLEEMYVVEDLNTLGTLLSICRGHKYCFLS